jgi:Tol biopolymer transport system component
LFFLQLTCEKNHKWEQNNSEVSLIHGDTGIRLLSPCFIEISIERYIMKQKIYLVVAVLALLITTLACTFSIGTPTSTSTGDQVATVVALTMQALTPVAASSPTAAPAAGLLPHALYFLNDDSTGIMQVFRLETDGKTLKRITSEPSAVGSYDVSPADGSVVYVANNQLVLVQADGSGRRVLISGGTVDSNNQLATSVNSPVFSPNGQTVAYGYKGLNLYDLASGNSRLVLEQKSDSNAPAGVIYSAKNYSPDGSKILVGGAIPNSDGFLVSVYDPATNNLVQLKNDADGSRICCTQQGWTSDNSTLYAAYPNVGFLTSGLWKLDAASGNVTTLLSMDAGGGKFNLAAQPYLAPDGQLYYFYANAAPGSDGLVMNPPLQIVRSAPDGVSGRTVLRPETFNSLNEALWAPDASFVITASAPAQGVNQGGIVELYYTDPQKGMMSLVPFGMQLKWGP